MLGKIEHTENRCIAQFSRKWSLPVRMSSCSKQVTARQPLTGAGCRRLYSLLCRFLCDGLSLPTFYSQYESTIIRAGNHPQGKTERPQQSGIEAYPAASFPVSHYSATIKEHYSEDNKEAFAQVTVAGRIMSINDKGKVFFIKIQDSKGIIQLYVKRDDICPGEDKTVFEKVVKGADLGDIIGATGFVFITRTGEISVHAQTVTLLSKSLKPLPVVKRDEQGNVYDAVTDPEFKYRQRYADLIINPEVKDTFIKRTKLINTIRDFLNEQGAIEVDTPVLQNIPGGAIARPFITHHNALDVPFYLRIANELYLKRLIVGGFDWVYEFSRNFRNEGMDRTHNPEFTVLEWYTAYKDYFWMMETTEQLMERIAIALHGTTDVQVGETMVSFKAPFKRVTIFDASKRTHGYRHQRDE